MGRQQSRNYGNLRSIVLLRLADKFETSSGTLTSGAVRPKGREKKDKRASHPPEAIVPEPSGRDMSYRRKIDIEARGGKL